MTDERIIEMFKAYSEKSGTSSKEKVLKVLNDWIFDLETLTMMYEVEVPASEVDRAIMGIDMYRKWALKNAVEAIKECKEN
jgi:hypothetical protein